MHVSWIIIRLLSIACAAFPLHTFSATVFKFSDTPPRITAHQPGLPGIRYSFLVLFTFAKSISRILFPFRLFEIWFPCFWFWHPRHNLTHYFHLSAVCSECIPTNRSFPHAVCIFCLSTNR